MCPRIIYLKISFALAAACLLALAAAVPAASEPGAAAPRPFGLPYAKMGFVNSDIDERGQVKPGAPLEQLYNLATDLRQSTNLASKEPDRVRAMRTRFLEITGPGARKTPAATD